MTTDDSTLLLAIAGDTERGFRLLIKKYQEPLYWHIRRLTVIHSDAEDALQETFIRAYRSLSQFRGDATLSSWIYRIATREALRVIEKRRQDSTLSLDDGKVLSLPSSLGSGGDYIDYGDRAALALQRAIKTLPPKQQLAFNMRYYDEMSFEDIAAALDSTAASVKQSYHIAKEKIIKYMNDYEETN